MEELKPLKEVCEPDGRHRYFGYTLDHLHSTAASIQLNSDAPEDVQNQFAIAKNAYLYSWFFYPFLPVSLFYSILAVEQALSIRVKEADGSMFSGGREPTLFPLLCYALRHRWITDTGFNIEGGAARVVPEKIARQFPDIPNDQTYSYTLLDALVGLRNSLAHGSYMVAPNMASLLERGAEIINQLFPIEGRRQG